MAVLLLSVLGNVGVATVPASAASELLDDTAHVPLGRPGIPRGVVGDYHFIEGSPEKTIRRSEKMSELLGDDDAEITVVDVYEEMCGCLIYRGRVYAIVRSTTASDADASWLTETLARDAGWSSVQTIRRKGTYLQVASNGGMTVVGLEHGNHAVAVMALDRSTAIRVAVVARGAAFLW
ncbi:MAG: hypothetical protein M3N53_06465 [Actinomycetota bacterium]|nr:hypothetical protein [Actinomycetota bacterium]